MKILFAIDKYSTDSSSIKMAKNVMAREDSAEITLLYVSHDSTSTYYNTAVGLKQVLTEDEWAYRNELERKLLSEFHPWRDRVRFQHGVGKAAKVICDIAESGKFDLVIVGKAHTHTRDSRIGPVVSDVLSHMKSPVLVAN